MLFVDQGEAGVFYDKVLNRDSIKLKDSRNTLKRYIYTKLGHIE